LIKPKSTAEARRRGEEMNASDPLQNLVLIRARASGMPQKILERRLWPLHFHF
jgi:hypothetical protein